LVINVFIKNRDDHAKNFSFLLIDDKWKLSPACDLLPSWGFNGFHTTAIAGNGDHKYSDIQLVADSVGLNKKRTKEISELIRDTVVFLKIKSYH
jgi:serine/threonine-protein kinase HipA